MEILRNVVAIMVLGYFSLSFIFFLSSFNFCVSGDGKSKILSNDAHIGLTLHWLSQTTSIMLFCYCILFLVY